MRLFGWPSTMASRVNTNRHGVLAPLRELWSNGQTEGQITKLKASSARCTDTPFWLSAESASSTLPKAAIIEIESDPSCVPPESLRINTLPRRPASKFRADQQTASNKSNHPSTFSRQGSTSLTAISIYDNLSK